MDTMSLQRPSAADQYRPELYVDAPTKMIWNGLVTLLCAIARHVTVRELRFDQVLDMLEPVLERGDVREALDGANADAVWLRIYRKRSAGRGHAGASEVGRVPVGKANWAFVKV